MTILAPVAAREHTHLATPPFASLTARRRWTVVALLCLAFMVAYIDRVNLSVAVTDQGFKRAFALDGAAAGRLMGAFFWTYTLLQLPAGWIVDRFGPRRTLAVGFAIWSIASGLAGLASTYAQLLALRLLLGIGEAVITPGGMTWIRHHFPERQRGLAVGVYMAAAKVGPAIGFPIAGLLLLEWGWRTMFLVLGFGSLAWLVPWSRVVPSDKPAPGAAAADPARSVRLSVVLRSPAIWGTLIGTFAYQYFNYFCLTWLPAYFAEHRGLSIRSSALFSGVSYIGMAVVAIASGWWADRMIARGGDPVRVRKGFTIAGLLLASTQLLGVVVETPALSLFFAVFSLSALGLATANYWALTQTLVSGGAVGRIVALQNVAANIPGIVAAGLTGWLKDVTGGYVVPMATVGVALLLGVASYAFLVRREYAPAQEVAA